MIDIHDVCFTEGSLTILEAARFLLERTHHSIPNASFEVPLLMRNVLKIDSLSEFILSHHKILTKEDFENCKDAVLRRANGEPAAYIINKKSFWDTELYITKQVLIPRPDTETLVELAIELLPKLSNIDILDLGTGSGCIAISLLKVFPNSRCVASDVSKEAISVAEINRDLHFFSKRMILVESDWFEKIHDQFDLIISNPPYISIDEFHCLNKSVKNHEPTIALTDQEDGLSHYKKIFLSARNNLKAKSFIILECGYNQSEKIIDIGKQYGFYHVDSKKDLSGKERAIAFQAQ